uniref:DM2 domain-containing protein n=1 Tax=viral metagenome TaxID=1070528 RepID=A0A6C0CLN5_9ZZZZ
MVKTTTPAPVSAPVATPAPIEKAPKKKASKKEESTPAPVEAAVPEAATDRTDLSTEINEDLAELMRNVQSRAALDNAIKVSVKSIEKKVAKLTKMMEKSTKKRKTSQNKMSGFEKPTAISDELAKFVGEQPGAMLARTAVSKKIHEYVKTNNLQNPANRRIIHPDAKLKKLLNTTGKDELSYFNLQKYLKVHFKKAETK